MRFTSGYVGVQTLLEEAMWEQGTRIYLEGELQAVSPMLPQALRLHADPSSIAVAAAAGSCSRASTAQPKPHLYSQYSDNL